jgi:hypothetical protein
MARTNFVKSRRPGRIKRTDGEGKLVLDGKGKPIYDPIVRELRCAACSGPIEIGQSYKWFKMKTTYGGIKRSYHPDCHIPPSHRTSSRMGEIYDAQEALAADLGSAESFDAIREALEAFAATVREVGEGYEESAQNMEDGFGHETYQSQEIRERAEGLMSWADEIESWDFPGDEPEQDDFSKLDQEAFDAEYRGWQEAEPNQDTFLGDGEAFDTAYAEWEDAEPSEDSEEFQTPDEEAFNEAVEEVLDEARNDAEGVADNCPV